MAFDSKDLRLRLQCLHAQSSVFARVHEMLVFVQVLY
jgi:hypothetical protein